MEQGRILREYLIRKIQILDEIAANTETQSRFIHRREMRGLGRVLDERAVLLGEIVEINRKVVSEQASKKKSPWAEMIEEVAQKQQAVIERSKQVVQEALEERALMAAELRRNNIQSQVKNQYVNQWAIVARGRRINEGG